MYILTYTYTRSIQGYLPPPESVCSYVRGDVVSYEMMEEGGVVMTQAVLYHGQQVQRWVGEIVEPVSTPIH